MGIKWLLIVVLICISLAANFEPFFMCILVIHMSSLEEKDPLPIFLIGLFVIFIIELYEFLIRSSYKSLTRYDL